jgi:hypothetical protein
MNRSKGITVEASNVKIAMGTTKSLKYSKNALRVLKRLYWDIKDFAMGQ